MLHDFILFIYEANESIYARKHDPDLASSFVTRAASRIVFSIVLVFVAFFNDQEIIPFYCSTQRTMSFLHHLIPLSATIAYGEWTTVPLHMISFSSLHKTPHGQQDALFMRGT